ncbi:hypothetical protein LTR08_001356 [Meristemomyces frigidus]|nr:hypothetical protein LTR08_001356 [Meristemomyces frigidus]
MGGTGKGDASIQAFFLPTPHASPIKTAAAPAAAGVPVGDGFTAEEVQVALRPQPIEPWHPSIEYTECDIRELNPGPRAVMFMGRVANIFDVCSSSKSPRAAKGCLKMTVKDNTGAVTVRLWFAEQPPSIRLGSLVSIWTDHISNGENGALSSTIAPLFVSLFPERDRSCHLMLHQNSDDGTLCSKPLGYRAGQPLCGLMTLQNFLDGGYDVVDAKVLVVVKSIGAKKKVTRKDESVTESINLKVHDDTAEATLGLWGTTASSPLSRHAANETNPEAAQTRRGWTIGETVLLLQGPNFKTGSNSFLNINASTLVDVDPQIPDADWLQRWALRLESREAINPPFPTNVFDLDAVKSGPVRCLFALGELDEFARAAPNETFLGYLNVLLTEIRLLENWKRNMLCSGECSACSIPLYANATAATCKHCEADVPLRLNPRIVAQVMDETACVASGKLLFSDRAWRDLLGREPEELLKLGHEEVKYISDRLLFSRVTLLFGWTGDESKAGGRICILGVIG